MWEAPSKGLGSWAEGKQVEHWHPSLLPDCRHHLVFPSTMGFFFSSHKLSFLRSLLLGVVVTTIKIGNNTRP